MVRKVAAPPGYVDPNDDSKWTAPGIAEGLGEPNWSGKIDPNDKSKTTTPGVSPFDYVYDPATRRDQAKNTEDDSTKGTRSVSTGPDGKKTTTETTPSNAADNIRADNEDDFRDSGSRLPADRTTNNPPMPGGNTPSAQPGSPAVATPGQNPAPGAGQATQAPQATGAPAAGSAAGPYTAPGGGQTSGTIADGGVAGAENGNNSAITKDMLDADGMYTVGAGDTWSDIAQRATGDMNNYQKMYDAQGGAAGGNIDNLAEGTKINLKDFANDVGNKGVSGDVTNPANGGPDGNNATQDFEIGRTYPSGTTLSEAQGFAATTPKADVDVASNAGSTPDITPPGGDAASAVPPQAAPETPDVTPPTPAAPANGKASSLRTAKDWLRWAAEGDAGGTTNETAPTTEQAADASTSTPDAGAATAPATNPAAPGTPSDSDVYDPNDPSQQQQQSMDAANPGAQAAGSSAPGTGGMDMSGIGDTIGGIASGIGGALPGLASGIGGMIPGLASGIGNAVSGIFSSKQDVDDWRRYAYPAGGGDDFDPETLPHIPFAGSGNPGPMDVDSSWEYTDKARKKMDDVTELGDAPLSTPMGDWQKQGSYDEADDPYREASIGYSTDDDSDVVRTFQAHLGETALGAGAGQGAGRFDDLAGAAQGFLRTAGRNYSLAEQSELVREGDKGGARNLASLNLAGTHYEEMDSLGW